MAENSKIEWTDHTFNPWRGCIKVHEGCAHCYAESLSKRNPGTLGIWGPNGTRVVAAESYWREPLKWNRAAEKAGERRRVFCASLADVFEDWRGPMENAIGEPLRLDPYQSLHDHHDLYRSYPLPGGHLVHPEFPDVKMNDVRHRLFALIDATPHLDWLLLTKRPENILRMWPKREDYQYIPEAGSLNEWPMYRRENVWIGTSISLQEHADKQIPELLKSRDLAPVLFLSCEPLLGPVNLRRRVQHEQGGCVRFIDPITGDFSYMGRDHRGGHPIINWVIVGGESGPGARPMHPGWARSLRDQCQAANVPFFFKQWGEWLPYELGPVPLWTAASGQDFIEAVHLPEGLTDHEPVCGWWWPVDDPFSDHVIYRRLGKHAAGRLLDGIEHSEFPRSVCGVV